MEGIDKILSLVQKVLQNDLSLEQAVKLLSSSEFKPHLKDKVITRLDEIANQLMLQAPPVAYLLSKFSYEACKIMGNLVQQPYCGLTLGRILLRSGRFYVAISLFEEVLRFFEEKNEKQAIGAVLGNLGIACYSLSDYLKAAEHHQQALKIDREIGDRQGEGSDLGNLGITYSSLGDLPRAIDFYQQALKIAREIGDRCSEGNQLGSLGNANSSLGDYPKAIEYYQHALKILREIEDRKGESAVLDNLGIVYYSLGDYTKAIEYYQQALKISQEIGDRQFEGNHLGNLGLAYASLGDYPGAIDFYQQALKISREIGDRGLEGATLDNLGLTYASLGDYPRAIEYYQHAMEISREIGDRQNEGNHLGNLGNAYFSLGDHPKAIEYHQQALKISREIGDRKGEGVTLDNLGLTYASLGDYPRAIEYCQQALKISREIGDRKNEGSSLGNLGNVYFSLGDYQQVIEYYQQALNIFRVIGDIDSERIELGNLGSAHKSLKENDKAYSYYKNSIDLTEKIRGVIKQEEYRSSYFKRSENVYDSIILLCNRMRSEQEEKLIESFEYLERSKSRTFLESLAHTPIKPSKEISTQLLEKESELLQKIRGLYVSKEKQKQVSLSEIQSLESGLDEVWNKIDKIDPEYVFMRKGKPLSFAQIQQLIKSQGERVCLVEYFLSADKILIFILRSDDTELKVEEVDFPAEEFRSYLDTFLKEIYSFGKENAIQNWQNLGRFLVDPIFKYLEGIDSLYFVPHRWIHYLPLHALRHDNYYMGEKYKIVYSPSASVISYCQNKRKDKRETCLSLGVVFEEEADLVAKIFKENSSVYKGIQVTKNLVEEESKGKDIIHFSCHGFFFPPMPMKSGLLLAQGEILTVEDIFKLKLNADLVTLSACQTGINEQKPGDDLVGLTRSFIYAGTPSVVVSLWPVYGPSTLELMEKFYSYLKEGKNKIEALQKAQLYVMNKPEYSHPYYWAPFILVGDWK